MVIGRRFSGGVVEWLSDWAAQSVSSSLALPKYREQGLGGGDVVMRLSGEVVDKVMKW